MTIAKKMQQFAEKSSWIRKMFEEGARLKAEYGAEAVCDFSLGNPDVPPPGRFQEVLRQVAADDTPGMHGYMPNGGFPHVREKMAARVGAEQGVAVQGTDVLMTCGAAGALNVVFKTILDPGDEVVVLAPFFVEYHFYVDNHGGVVRVVPTREDFGLDLEALEQAVGPKTKAVLVNSPNNPTGQVYTADELARLGELLEAASERAGHVIYLLADEPYRAIVYDGVQVPSIFAAYHNSIVVTSFSKDLSLPGERIGYLAVHPDIEAKAELLDGLTLANRILGFVNAPALMQRVVAELVEAHVDVSVYARRRDLFCRILDEAGYEYVRPKGAFYLFPRVPGDDVAFCGLLRQEKILAVPGRGFGAPGHVRLAFCVDEQVIRRAADGLARALEQAARQA